MKKTKRAWGDGSISGPDADGYYEVRISQGTDADGKRRRTRARVRSMPEARAKLEEMRQLLGRRGVQKPMTLESYLQSWISRKAVELEPKTVRTYETAIANIVPLIGQIRIDRLEASHISAAMRTIGERQQLREAKRIRDREESRRKKKRAAPAPRNEHTGLRTVQQAYDTLRAALNFAVDRDRIIPASPLRAVPRQKVRRQIDYLSRDEALAFLGAVDADRYRALWHLEIATGMRMGEIAGLRWADVDFSRGSLSLRRALKEKRKLGDTKSAGSRRLIDLPPSVVAELKAHRTKHPDDDHVFTTQTGTALHASNLERRHLHPALERAGLRRVRFHDLRHTAAAIRLLAGQHPKIVQELLGHSSIRTTLDVYGHLMPSMGRDAASAYDATMGN